MNENPLVLCLTNTVAANFTANCLLAVGARPAMVEEPAEAAELASVADAVLVNVGTVTAGQAEAMRAAVAAADAKGTPWVLDPVGVQLLSYRRGLVQGLLAFRPAIVRGNAAEMASLEVRDAVTLATGAVDLVRGPDGALTRVDGGDAMLQAVTATGCAQGGICAAFLGRGMTPCAAAVAASRLFKRAGEVAAGRAKGPGSFGVAFIDALGEAARD